MKPLHHLLPTASLGLLVSVGCCSKYASINPPAPLGSETDQMMEVQEVNAEAAKFVVYMHEFELNRVDSEGVAHGWRLNEDGEDHLKRIAIELQNGVDFPVVVERSRTSVKPGTEYEYPVHLNEDLDEKRRQIVVASLERMGIADAESKVYVSPAFSHGLTGIEAARAYTRGISGGRAMNGGFGFGGGGFGGGAGGGFGY
jgi:uncharacterized membrane protein YgcG